MKATHCSINWGKGMMSMMLLLVLALMMIALGMLTQNAVPNGVGVDWGNRPVQPCPPGVKNCKVTVDWGSLTAPCPPTDANCGSGPVAVDWGNSFSTWPPFEPPADQVAVDWGSRKRS